MTPSTLLIAVWYSSDCRQVLGTCLDLVEQPDVLDRDHSLIGERA